MFGFDSLFGNSGWPGKPRLQSKVMMDQDFINSYMAHLRDGDESWMNNVLDQVAGAMNKNKDKTGMNVEVLEVGNIPHSPQAHAILQWVLEYIGYRVHYYADDLMIAWWNEEPAEKSDAPSDQPTAPLN